MVQTVRPPCDAANTIYLAAIAKGRSRPLNCIQRARLVLFSAGRLSVQDAARLLSAAPLLSPGSGAKVRRASTVYCATPYAHPARRLAGPRRWPTCWRWPPRSHLARSRTGPAGPSIAGRNFERRQHHPFLRDVRRR